jgi:hypothetical protein
VRHATRHLSERLDAYFAGEISFAEFDANIQGWINHVRYADSWGLRKHMFRQLVPKKIRPAPEAQVCAPGAGISDQ